jgi:hypothetical protein
MSKIEKSKTEGERVLRDFMAEIKAVYGWTTEVSYAIARDYQHLLELVRINPNNPNMHHSYSMEQSDGRSFSHHQGRTQEIAERMKPDGASMRRLRNTSIIYFYTLWEDNFRDQIASLLGCERNDVKSDLFGDLKNYRHAIAHANGKLTTTSKVLKLIAKGDVVSLSHEQFAEILKAIAAELSRIADDHFGLKLTFHNPIPIMENNLGKPVANG